MHVRIDKLSDDINPPSNRALTRTDALNQAESYAYDLAGNLVRYTDRKGQVTGYQYDFLNRRTFIGLGATVAAPTTYTNTVTYAWDAGNRVTQIVDSQNGAITRGYDGLDRLTTETTPQGTVGYTYDAAGRRTQLTAAGQPDTGYAYDNANRLTGITQGSQTVGFSYDNANRRTSLTLPNGINVAYGYDNANQLTSLTYSQGGTTLGDISYSYDAAGRRTRQGGSFARVNLPATINGAIAYDAANRLTTWDGNSLAYDPNGNLQGVAGDTYAWDARNRLAGITGSSTASFSYDAAGRRAGKTIAGATTNFLYDGWQTIQELTSTNTLSASLLTGDIDELFSRTEGGATQSYLTDALNSTLRLTDSAGTKVTDYTYEAYGKTTNDNAASTNGFQYTGRENDNTNLYYYRNRYYHPTLGRFISEDPIGLAGGYNQFAYVGNNPLSFTDPLGLNPIAGALTGAEIGTAILPGIGTVVGGIVGAGIGAWVGWNVLGPLLNENKTPNTGEPGSCHVNPNNGQERKYGADGKPEWDIDWHPDHGAGVPHGHNWDRGPNGEPIRGPGVPLSPWPQGRGQGQ